jgi:hypothetical protein
MLGIPLRQIIIALLWSSFLSSGIACGLLFAWIDPTVILEQFGLDPDNRLSGYSLAFFFFWLIGIANVLICLYFLRPVSHSTNN